MREGESSQLLIERYLLQVRAGLRRLPDADVAEILQELRSHIQERAEASGTPTEAAIRAALDSLGSPRDLARMYITENMMSRAAASRSPWLILRGMYRWAGMSVWGFVIFLMALIGYALGAGFFVCAALKPFFPANVGLWWRSNPLLVNLGGQWPVPHGARELLGWWLIPVAIAAGSASLFLTHRFTLFGVRRFRRMRFLHA